MLLKDSILEQSPYLQSFMNKARIQGQEQGIEQGIEKGIEKGRKTLLAVLHELVDLRFRGVPMPAAINHMDLDQLKGLVVSLSTAPDKAAARKILKNF